LASYHDVVNAVFDERVVIIDTRTAEEFLGEKHKSGAARPGRIPRAINHDWANCVQFDKDLRFKSLKDIHWEMTSQGLADRDTPIIVYCHSGVRSSHSAFVLREILGYTNVKNYDGSWTEWSHLAPDSLIESSGL
jgi:thiosulfate/3-mercaptopyruvate sulfurtransferase